MAKNANNVASKSVGNAVQKTSDGIRSFLQPTELNPSLFVPNFSEGAIQDRTLIIIPINPSLIEP